MKSSSKGDVDQSIKLKISAKIIAKTRTAIPISRISSRIGPPLFFNLKDLRNATMNIYLNNEMQNIYLNPTRFRYCKYDFTQFINEFSDYNTDNEKHN